MVVRASTMGVSGAPSEVTLLMEGLTAAKKSCESSAVPKIAIDAPPPIFVMVMPGPSLSGNGNGLGPDGTVGTVHMKSAVKLVPIPPAAGPLIRIHVGMGPISPNSPPLTLFVLATCSMIKIFPAGIEMESPEFKYPIHGTGAADARRVKLKLHNATNVFAMVFFIVVLMCVVVVVVIRVHSALRFQERPPPTARGRDRTSAASRQSSHRSPRSRRAWW